MIVLVLTCSTAHAGGERVPPELAEKARLLIGTWKCTGKANHSGTIYDQTSVVTHQSELGGAWIATSAASSAGARTSGAHNMTTYDPVAKKWFRMSANAEGAHAIQWGTTTPRGIVWEGDGYFSGHTVKLRGTEDLLSAKEERSLWEFSTDGGKTWTLDHEQTCRK
jgi:hypothetical protein